MSALQGFPRTYLLYVDESGDPGAFNAVKGNSNYYILSGLIIPVDRWKSTFDQHRQIRYLLRQKFELPVRDEIHTADWLGRNRSKQAFPLALGSKFSRAQALKEYVQRIVLDLVDIQFLHIHLDKSKYTGRAPIDIICWKSLIQRFNNFLERQSIDNIAAPAQGLIFADQTNEVMLRNLLRKMRAYNPVPSKYGGTRQLLCTQVIEDPVLRGSQHSYFIQIADVSAYLLYQKLYPRGSMRRYNIDRLFDLLHPRLLLVASSKDPYQMGIVHIQ